VDEAACDEESSNEVNWKGCSGAERHVVVLAVSSSRLRLLATAPNESLNGPTGVGGERTCKEGRSAPPGLCGAWGGADSCGDAVFS